MDEINPILREGIDSIKDQLDHWENSLNIFRTYIPLDHIYINLNNIKEKVPLLHPNDLIYYKICRIDILSSYTAILKNITYHFELISSRSKIIFESDKINNAIMIITESNEHYISYQ